MTNPLVRNLKYLYFYTFIWIIVAIIHFLFLNINQSVIWHWALIDSFLFNLLFAAFGLSFWYNCRYVALEKTRFNKILLHHSAAAIFASFIWIGLTYFILVHILQPDEIYKQFLEKSIPARLLTGFLFYSIIITFYYVHIYSTNLQEHLLKEAELKTLVKEAELKSLKFQINPHFIFNSLNSINSLIISNPDKAGEMTSKLGDFLRYTLSKNDQQKSTLKEELNSMKLYLDIEKIRFENKFDFIENIQNGCLDLTVPNMILQPIIENAIKHGVYESIEKITINLVCKISGECLIISLENNFDPEAISRKGEGIGLKNIENRLELLYKQKNLMQIDKEISRFKVSIYIPITKR